LNDSMVGSVKKIQLWTG